MKLENAKAPKLIKLRLFGYPITLQHIFRRCSYCGGWMKGRGVRHPVFTGARLKPVNQWACMKCEMDFDDE